MKIGIDLDEVLADFLSALITFHNETYGTRLTRDQFKSYRFWETWGGTKEEAVEKVHSFFKTPYARAIEPVAGSQEAVRALGESNELYLITARPNEVAELTHYWIAKHFDGAFAGIHFANHFSKNGSLPKTKASICDALGVDMLVEDSVDFALECMRDGRDIFLLDCPWNRTDELPGAIYRVSSWKEILQHEKVR